MYINGDPSDATPAFQLHHHLVFAGTSAGTGSDIQPDRAASDVKVSIFPTYPANAAQSGIEITASTHCP